MLATEIELYVDTESMPGANSALTGVRCTKCKRHVASWFMPVTLDSIVGATDNHTCKPFLTSERKVRTYEEGYREGKRDGAHQATDRLDGIVRTLKGTAEELAAMRDTW
jgi:hypothetical protein